MKKSETIILGIILSSLIIGAYFYPRMPEQFASHWNFKGEVDGYMPKFWGLFIMPIIAFVLFLLFILIPKIDPLKKNIDKFRKYFDGFTVIINLFLLYVHTLAILWNIGARFNMVRVLAPAFGTLFYCSGILTKNTKKNWFIGIKTPWTLSSEKVWNKTHKIGGKLFKIAGIIAFSAILFTDYALFLIIVPGILVAFYTFVYSYLEYRKDEDSVKTKKSGIG